MCGIHLEGGTLALEGCDISSGPAGGCGVYNDSGHLTVSHCDIRNCGCWGVASPSDCVIQSSWIEGVIIGGSALFDGCVYGEGEVNGFARLNQFSCVGHNEIEWRSEFNGWNDEVRKTQVNSFD